MPQQTTIRERLRALPSLKGPFKPFHPNSLPATPHVAFSQWLDDAIAEEIVEPHAMTLSTVDENSHADARVLILKDVDERGWHFSIKGKSPKGQQLDQHPEVALTFYWAKLGRQVRIRGKATQLPRDECARDFASRPESSKISALASNQSQVLASRDDLTESLGAARQLFKDQPDFIAEDWKVFAVNPKGVEFWQGASDRLHWRVLYTQDSDGTWVKQNLWP